jgi:hypothetical protein
MYSEWRKRVISGLYHAYFVVKMYSTQQAVTLPTLTFSLKVHISSTFNALFYSNFTYGYIFHDLFLIELRYF